MDIFSIFTLFGGLAFFLYGMNVMSSGLEKIAGGRLEKGLKKVTSNPIKSLLFGAGITIAIQSSSAMTVMLVGFVNSGIMELSQTIGIIMGSNIGTTLTAWVLSLAGINSDNILLRMLNPESFTPIVAAVGVGLNMISKKQKVRDIGSIMVGFSVLMFGMTLMSNAVSPLAEDPNFSNILVTFKNPIVGVLAGAIFTGIIQSSAASVGILQALSMTGNISFGMAIPIIMGQNIGTCVTALLSSIGVNKNAKRVAVVHIYFNIIGTVICLSVFYLIQGIIGFSFIDNAIGPVGIAGIHSIFNIVTTAMLLPFSKLLEKLARLTVKDSKQKEDIFLDTRLWATPSVAIAECKNRMFQMVALVRESVKLSRELLDGFSEEKFKLINENEDKTDKFEDNIGTYLLRVGGNEISEQDSKEVSKILHIIGDIERIGDHALNIAEVSRELKEKELTFSKEAKLEINNLMEALEQIIDLTFKSYLKNSYESACKVEPLEEVIDLLCDELKEKHVNRLRNGLCTIEVGFIFNDLIADVERISDHCSNIAVCVLRVNKSTFDTHLFLQEVKSNQKGQFMEDYNEYKAKYVGSGGA